MSMSLITRIIGLLIAALGAYGVAKSLQDELPFDKWKTALIPIILGVLLIIAGFIAIADSLRKHAMHAAALIALLGFLGAGWRLLKTEKISLSEPASVGVVGTTVLCFVLVVLCIISFVHARLNKETPTEDANEVPKKKKTKKAD